MRVAVFGLWHLGCVTAACLAEAGHQVIGLDLTPDVVTKLNQGSPPVDEPGLVELIADCRSKGKLTFSTDSVGAFQDAEVVWVTFDTPVNDQDEADVPWVEQQLLTAAPALRPGTLVLISSQVPVGFTAKLEQTWAGRGLCFAVSPENLRLGKAIDYFRKPERIVVGCRDEQTRAILSELLKPFCSNLVGMTIESAEMTKHALNAFLATSVTFINELARLCEAVGADAKEVEQGLKSESRIGPKAYLSPGANFAGGTLARDVRFLIQLGQRCEVGVPLFGGVWASNNLHKNWLRDKLTQALEGIQDPIVCVLGLTYKPGTNTLRRSSSVELCQWLKDQGVQVRAHDPAIRALPADLSDLLELCESPREALANCDAAVIATPWPEYKKFQAELFLDTMRRPVVIDQNHFLAGTVVRDPRVGYQAIGTPNTRGTAIGQAGAQKSALV